MGIGIGKQALRHYHFWAQTYEKDERLYRQNTIDIETLYKFY